jgi:hypothetical protein
LLNVPSPGGWELVGRMTMVIGLAGVLASIGRLIARWLRDRPRDRP